MADIWMIVPGLMGGFLIGLAFFGSLRWTVERLRHVDQPARFFLGSFLIRTAVALVAFYVVAGGSWQRLLAAAVGFFIARMVLVRLLTFDEYPSNEVQS